MLLSDLKIGITFAIFNLEENVPRSIDLLKICQHVTYNIACTFMYADRDLFLDIERFSNLISFGDIGQKNNKVAGDLFLSRN